VQLPVGFRVVSAAGEFEQRVEDMVRSVPAGTVASYGRVAGWVGAPGAARAVGGALAAGLDAPWHRVVTASGRLVPGYEREHERLLAAEGVTVRAGYVAAPIPWWEGPSPAAAADGCDRR
jgi:methylated-DNA-protein-cysteine methyltransferase-like protein